MELIIICLWDVEKMFKKHHHQSFLKAKYEIRCSLTLGFVWSPYFLKKLPLFNSQQSYSKRCSKKLLQEYNFYSLNCQAVILRPTKILLGLVFQSVAEKLQLLNCIKHVQSKSVFLMASSLSQLPFWNTG